jgi:Tol biopolymer transport system component
LIVYNSNRNKGLYDALYQTRADGGGEETKLYQMERLIDSPEWSHDGQSIVFTGGVPGSSNDLFILPLSGARKARRLFASPFAEDSPAFSPDDQWIAYNSDSSGRQEVYVRDVSGGREVPISRDGGWAPRWRGDGKELFFLGLDGRMMAIPTEITATGLRAGIPRPIFQTSLRRLFDRRPFAVSRDGKRFLLAIREQRPTPVPLTVVVNWQQPR